jgi:hypothetical protein
MNSISKLFAAVVLTVVGWSCAPLPCESVSRTPDSVCRKADAGAIAANTPFVIQGQTFANGGCQVTIDGGQINLVVDSMSCPASSGSGFEAAPAAPRFVACNVPALDAGTYTVTSSQPVTFTIPESADAGVPLCP